MDFARDLAAPVAQVAADGLYLATGTDAGVQPGARGTIERDGRVLGEVEVRHATATSCFAVVTRLEADAAPAAGDRVLFRGIVPPARPAPRAPATPDRAAAGDVERPFTPLLAPAVAAPAESRGNYLHGSAGLATSWLADDENGRDYANLRLFTSGEVERLGDGPWSLQWRFDLNRRSGDGYADDSQQDRWRLRADTLLVRRHFEDGSVLGVGRFLPHALPGIGRLDGGYGERVLGDGVRVGGALGLRPDRDDLGPRADEWVAAGWTAFDGRTGGGTRWNGALGALASWYEGDADQHALLADLGANFSGGHWLRASTQLDADGDGDAGRSGVGVTRLHVTGWWRASELLALRPSWSHWQNPDTESLRAVAPNDASYGRGRTRAALAAVESFGGGAALEQEAAWLTGDGTPGELQVTLRGRDATLLSSAAFGGDLALFNLVGVDQDGLGASAGVTWMPAAAWLLRFGWDTTSLEIDGGESFLSNTLSLFATWQAGVRTTAWARAAKGFGDRQDTTGLDLGLTWRF